MGQKAMKWINTHTGLCSSFHVGLRLIGGRRCQWLWNQTHPLSCMHHKEKKIRWNQLILCLEWLRLCILPSLSLYWAQLCLPSVCWNASMGKLVFFASIVFSKEIHYFLRMNLKWSWKQYFSYWLCFFL